MTKKKQKPIPKHIFLFYFKGNSGSNDFVYYHQSDDAWMIGDSGMDAEYICQYIPGMHLSIRDF